MTGKEWDSYFKKLDPSTRKSILVSLETLNLDPMFNRAYGNDFKQLAYLIK